MQWPTGEPLFADVVEGLEACEPDLYRLRTEALIA
jgi:hypothetical protein